LFDILLSIPCFLEIRLWRTSRKLFYLVWFWGPLV
jgi:hypothetical protein